MKKLNWYYKGIIFAVFVLISNSAIDLVAGDFTFDNMEKRVLLSLISGLIFGLFMKYKDQRQSKKSEM
ncbi:hypothetical protein FG167_14705 [Lacinutrix sp. WUR7]|uniref:hypothetical protein n=1 Tax=Lacinutrix sp. WUR7 TaxID=2653681 RepID=UPI00193D4C6E|nr:hypothetical protein [Lacinutrix sp. WUR7]QRM90432.1 hypothetical protein FG167_14705 [Lacinutrix sp. WUR7]